MEWDEHTFEKVDVFHFHGRGQARRDRTQYLQQLGQPIVRLIVMHYAQKQVHNLLFNVRAEGQEFAVESVQYSLEVVSLAGIF